LSSPDIRVELTSLGDGNEDPRVVVFPVDPLGNEMPFESISILECL